MSIWIEKDENDATARRVPCRIFTSTGTGPDTGAQGDAVLMAVHSLTTISLSSALTAIHASQGMYMIQLTASEVSLLGTHPLYHIAGDFPQHIATVQVVNNNPFSTQSNQSNVTLHAGTHSSVTIQGLSNYANISNVTLHAGTHSNVTIQGLSNYANISNVTLHAGTHSNVTIQGVTRVNSGVTLNADTHSGATIQGVSNYANFPLTSVATSVWSTLRSNFTTPGSFGEYTYSQVTGTSSGTVQGVTRALNLSANGDKTGYTLSAAGLADFFDTDTGTNYAGAVAGSVVKEIADNAGGTSLSEEGIADAVWAHSGRTLDGTSIATVFVNPGSVWSALRSAYTTPGSFGEYVYSQVTGTSSGTIQGVTRLNSAVTLNANTHSGATIQGLSNYANISNVTLHEGVHSGATVAINDIAPAAYSGVSFEVLAGGIQAASLGAGTITAAKFAAGAVDAAALATDAGQEIADRVLTRNIEGGSDTGRIVKEALAPLRNRVVIQGSVGTVFKVNDSDSWWTFSPSLGTAPISGVDPTT